MQSDDYGFRPKSLRIPKRRQFRLLRVLGVTAAVLIPMLLYATQPLFGLGAAPGSIATAPVPAQNLATHVRKLVEIGGRDYLHPENLDAAAAYIRTELARSGARMSAQVYSTGGRTYRNVIA